MEVRLLPPIDKLIPGSNWAGAAGLPRQRALQLALAKSDSVLAIRVQMVELQDVNSNH